MIYKKYIVSFTQTQDIATCKTTEELRECQDALLKNLKPGLNPGYFITSSGTHQLNILQLVEKQSMSNAEILRYWFEGNGIRCGMFAKDTYARLLVSELKYISTPDNSISVEPVTFHVITDHDPFPILKNSCLEFFVTHGQVEAFGVRCRKEYCQKDTFSLSIFDAVSLEPALSAISF